MTEICLVGDLEDGCPCAQDDQVPLQAELGLMNKEKEETEWASGSNPSDFAR